MRWKRMPTHSSRQLPATLPHEVEVHAANNTSLQERKETEWHDSVEIVFGDMRTIDLPVQADIIVSELLGSFADNELSPECLDGAMRFLKRALITPHRL